MERADLAKKSMETCSFDIWHIRMQAHKHNPKISCTYDTSAFITESFYMVHDNGSFTSSHWMRVALSSCLAGSLSTPTEFLVTVGAPLAFICCTECLACPPTTHATILGPLTRRARASCSSSLQPSRSTLTGYRRGNHLCAEFTLPSEVVEICLEEDAETIDAINVVVGRSNRQDAREVEVAGICILFIGLGVIPAIRQQRVGHHLAQLMR